MKEINLDTKDTKEKYFLMKVKEHKTEIAIATVTAFAVVVGIVIHKNSSVFNISEKYIAAKKAEWQKYRSQVTEWEINEYLYKF